MVTARDIFNRVKESRVGTAAGALATFVSNGGRTVSAEVYEERMAACRSCQHYERGAAPTCAVCGCFLKVKTRFPAEQCPLDPPKWAPVSDVPNDRQCGACT